MEVKGCSQYHLILDLKLTSAPCGLFQDPLPAKYRHRARHSCRRQLLALDETDRFMAELRAERLSGGVLDFLEVARLKEPSLGTFFHNFHKKRIPLAVQGLSTVASLQDSNLKILRSQP